MYMKFKDSSCSKLPLENNQDWKTKYQVKFGYDRWNVKYYQVSVFEDTIYDLLHIYRIIYHVSKQFIFIGLFNMAPVRKMKQI